MKKKVVKAVMFLVVLAAILVVLGPVFQPREPEQLSQLEGLGQVDYLVVGDSEAWASFQPMQVWQSNGFTGYNFGKAGLRLQDFYDQLETILQSQRPKVLLLETDILYKNVFSLTEAEGFVTSALGKLFPFIRYHERWTDFLPGNSAEVQTERSVFRGAYYNRTIVPYADADYYKQTTDTSKGMFIYYRYCMEKIISLCKQNQIQIILYSSPSPKNWSYEMHNGLEQFAQEQEIEFIDFNLIQEEIGIDWTEDNLDDGDHVNFTGALKVTAYLADYLAENTDLKDHRGESGYEVWDEDLSSYLAASGQSEQGGE